MKRVRAFAQLVLLVILLQASPVNAFLDIDLSRLKEKVENLRKSIGELGDGSSADSASSSESESVTPRDAASSSQSDTGTRVKGSPLEPLSAGLPWEKHRHWLDGRWCFEAAGVRAPNLQKQFLLDPADPLNLTSAINYSVSDSSTESGEREISEQSLRSKLDLIGPDRYEITSFYIMSSDRHHNGAGGVESREVLRFRVDEDYSANPNSGVRRLYIEDWTIVGGLKKEWSEIKKLTKVPNLYLTPCHSERKRVFSDQEFEAVKESMRKYGRDQFEIKNIALLDSPPPQCRGFPPSSASRGVCRFEDSLLGERVNFSALSVGGLVVMITVTQKISEQRKDLLGNPEVVINNFDTYINDLIVVLNQRLGEFKKNEKRTESVTANNKIWLEREGKKICDTKHAIGNILDSKQACESSLQRNSEKLESMLRQVCGDCERDVYVFEWDNGDTSANLVASVAKVKTYPSSINDFKLIIATKRKELMNVMREGFYSRAYREGIDNRIRNVVKSKTDKSDSNRTERMKDF